MNPDDIPEELRSLPARKETAPYLPRLIQILHLEEPRSPDSFTALSWIDDTRLISFEHRQNQARIWDTTHGETLQQLELPQPLERLAGLPDGSGLVACFTTGLIAVIDPEWGSLLSSVQVKRDDDSWYFAHLLLSPDSEMLYVSNQCVGMWAL